MTHWDGRFMQLALSIGMWSKDRTTKVGCIIVGPSNEIRCTGFNGFPRGADDERAERYERPAKYLWTEHAERNAIYNAALIGIPLNGCRMYLPWFPCMECARAIVQVGIIELIAFAPANDHPKWGEDFQLATQLFKECGVNIRYLNSLDFSGKIPGTDPS